MGRVVIALAALLALAIGHTCGAATNELRVSDACQWDGFESAVQRFSRIIQFKTVSDVTAPNHVRDAAEFGRMDEFLRGAFPRVFQQLKVEKVGCDSLSYLITWQGSQPDLRPVLFISHLDVVPVAEASEKDWTHPPFSGEVADGFVWGRGTMDVKVSAVALLEAASALLEQGWSPQRTLLFGFGQDEEVGGGCGAVVMSKLLESRGVKLEVIWDEGTSILLDGLKPLITRPLALVGTAEKGYQSVKVHITSAGGHSSLPPTDGSGVGDVMGRVLGRLSTSPPAPKLVAPVTDMLRGAAEYAPAWLAALLSTIGVLPGADTVVARFMASSGAQGAALTRTTAAVTGVTAGVADNVLPQQGTININTRLLPGDTPQDVLTYLTSVIGPKDMARVTLELGPPGTSQPPSPVTPVDGPHYKLLKQAIQEFWHVDEEPVAVLPVLLPGGTDSSAYAAINHQRGTLRFVPRRATVQDAHRAHGTNERLAVTDFKGALCTYRRGLQLFGRLGELEGRGSAGPAAGGAHKGVAAGRAGAFGGRRATPGLGRAGVSLAPRVVGQGVAAE